MFKRFLSTVMVLALLFTFTPLIPKAEAADYKTGTVVENKTLSADNGAWFSSLFNINTHKVTLNPAGDNYVRVVEDGATYQEYCSNCTYKGVTYKVNPKEEIAWRYNQGSATYNAISSVLAGGTSTHNGDVLEPVGFKQVYFEYYTNSGRRETIPEYVLTFKRTYINSQYTNQRYDREDGWEPVSKYYKRGGHCYRYYGGKTCPACGQTVMVPSIENYEEQRYYEQRYYIAEYPYQYILFNVGESDVWNYKTNTLLGKNHSYQLTTTENLSYSIRTTPQFVLKNFVFRNCTFSGFPTWFTNYIASADRPYSIYFENCTFNNVSFPSFRDVYFKGCKGTIAPPSGFSPLAVQDNTISLNSSGFVNYTDTTKTPQFVYSNSNFKLDLDSYPNQAAIGSINLSSNSGGGLKWTTSSQQDPVVGGANNLTMRLKRANNLTGFAGKSGDWEVTDAIPNDLSITNSSMHLSLTSSKTITVSGSALSNAYLRANTKLLVSGGSFSGSSSTLNTYGGTMEVKSNTNSATNANYSSSGLMTLTGDRFNGTGTAAITGYGGVTANNVNAAGLLKLAGSSSNVSYITGSVKQLNITGKNITLSGVSVSNDAYICPTGELAIEGCSLGANTTIFTGTSTLPTLASNTFTGLIQIQNRTAEEMPLEKLNFPGGVTLNCTNREGSFTLRGCTTSGKTTVNGTTAATIDGGTFTGAPALVGTNTTVKRGTFTDTSGNSQFLIDPDSEATVTTSGNKTVTTVKLSNPPLIIDWAEFPGLDIDLSAPTIEVVRNPADARTPTDQVSLTIRAQDPNGADSPRPISINGGAFQASPAVYTCTENQIVSIVARDANGNTREYQVSIGNIDAAAPEVIGFTQSTEAWTRNPIRVYCNATDDVKLNLTPYKFEFHPNSGGATVTSSWQADRSYQVTENGTLYCYVRDSLGKQTKSDPYYVRNIDTIAPTANYQLSPPNGSVASPTVGVTIDLTLVNTGDPVTDDGSALAAAAVKWNDNESWSEDLSRTVYENGVYNIRVRDSVGNVSPYIPVTVSNISSEKPVIDSLSGTHLLADYVQSPVTLKVAARSGGSIPLASKPYSWDGGKSWTSLDSYKIYENGEYSVKVRDETGTVSEASIIVSNIDAVKPTASVYLFKGLPADGSGTGPDDYVWKIRVEAEDIGSGIDHIETLWDGGTHTSFPIIQDVEEAGVYGIVVYDKAGNQTYAEKIVTNESIGNATGSNSNAYVEIEVPTTGTGGSYFNASIGDLVFGPTGAYNKVTSEFKTYQTGEEGITANIVATAKSSTWLTGYATFNSVKYPVTFGGADGIRGGRDIEAKVFIPISGLTTDTRNGRLVVVLQEWADSTKSTLKREGSATLYTSVQINDPKVNYTYNRATDEMSMVATSAVAGISSLTYDLGSGAQAYTAPFTVGGASTVKLVATDNVGNATTIELEGSNLSVAGEGGGTLPTEGITASGVNSYYIAGRSSETYIIGGNRSNTDNVPSQSVFDAILGS